MQAAKMACEIIQRAHSEDHGVWSCRDRNRDSAVLAMVDLAGPIDA
jgi:hypothetical protein